MLNANTRRYAWFITCDAPIRLKVCHPYTYIPISSVPRNVAKTAERTRHILHDSTAVTTKKIPFKTTIGI